MATKEPRYDRYQSPGVLMSSRFYAEFKKLYEK